MGRQLEKLQGSAALREKGVKFTARETQVITLLSQGMSDKEISRETGLAHGTIRGVIHVICAKLDAPNRTAAAVKFERMRAKDEDSG